MVRNNRTVDRIQAVWNILGGEEGVDRLIRGEITISEPERTWREQDDVIYFSVTSDGTTGEEWIKRLESKNFRVSDYAKSVLRSLDFKPTSGVTYKIAVLKGRLFSDNDRVTSNIHTKAHNSTFTQGQKLFDPGAEIPCLIREKFTDEEIEAMGLWWIVAIHKTIKDSDGDLNLLFANRGSDGRWLDTFYGYPSLGWNHEHGFAFVVSQV